MVERKLIFKEFKPMPRAATFKADRVWIHDHGDLVVLLDGVSGCSDPVGAVEHCLDFLNHSVVGSPDLSPQQLLSDLHENLQNYQDKMAVAACVYYKDGDALCAWVGNPRLYLITDEKMSSILGDPLSQPTQVLGMEGEVIPRTTSFSVPPDGICLLSSDGLGHQKLLEKKEEIQVAHSNVEWQSIGESSAVDDDWSMVVFPIEQSFSFEKNTWPYNPFVGPQEDREHEKRGLAQIADALFADEDFDGFRIVGGARFARSRSSRLLDGILVSPWGIVCLELKDHNGQIQLPLYNRLKMLIRDGSTHHEETNPVFKMSEALRTFSEFDLGCEIRGELRKIGAVVFTNPQVNVLCQFHDGTEKALPSTSAEVIVATPTSLPKQLKSIAKSFLSKRAKAPLSPQQIQEICAKLTEPSTGDSDGEQGARKIGRFLVQTKPNEEESTSYYQVFDGLWVNRNKKVWIKKFPRAHLARGKQSQVEESRLREIEALPLLSLHGLGCVQQLLGKEEAEDGLFVILEYIEGPRLDQWLSSGPSRQDRLDMLKKIASILVLLEEEKIVHRGLSPHCIRIRSSNGKPVLINFELCQMDVVATLPLSGRRLLDIQYVAKEVHALGASIDSAADIYSFGKIICLTLANELPFRTFEDQIMKVKKPGFWDRFSQQCSLTSSQGKDLARMMSMNPAKRPSSQEVIDILEEWN